MRNLTLIAALTMLSCVLGIARPGVSIAQNIVEEELGSNRSGSRERGNVGEDRRVRREDFREGGQGLADRREAEDRRENYRDRRRDRREDYQNRRWNRRAHREDYRGDRQHRRDRRRDFRRHRDKPRKHFKDHRRFRQSHRKYLRDHRGGRRDSKRHFRTHQGFRRDHKRYYSSRPGARHRSSAKPHRYGDVGRQHKMRSYRR